MEILKREPTIWMWSDLHLGHEKMYSLPFPASEDSSKPIRPFSSADEADEYMIEQYNQSVNHEDKVYFLGDICMNKKKLNLLSKMKYGHKYLVMGNHDDQAPIKEYKQYFNKIYGVLYMKDLRSILTHVPIHPSYLGNDDNYKFKYNCHGHAHDHTIKIMTGTNEYLRSDDPRYINLCVEKTGYRPICEEELRSWML